MYCHKCGNLLPQAAKFCVSCGEGVFIPEPIDRTRDTPSLDTQRDSAVASAPLVAQLPG
jgi:zinc-ribbon domain